MGYPLKVDYSWTYYECTSRENTEREVPLRPREHDVRRIRVSHLALHELRKNGTVVSAFDLGGRFVAVAEDIYIYLKGYALCRRPPLSGRGLRGGGYVALAHLPC